MPGFDDAWSFALKNAHVGAQVSPELQPLLRDVYISVVTNRVDLIELKKSLERLLFSSLKSRADGGQARRIHGRSFAKKRPQDDRFMWVN